MKLKKEVISLVLAGSLVLGGVSYLPNGGAASGVASAADTKEESVDDLSCGAWWSAHTKGIKISKKETTFSFTSTTNNTADKSWHCPTVLVYSSTDGKVYAADSSEGKKVNYTEYLVVRGDMFTMAADFNKEGASFNKPADAPKTDGTDTAYLEKLKKGAECTGSVKLENGKLVLQYTVAGVKSVATVPVAVPENGDLLIALTGEQCELTKIKFVVPVDAAGTTTGSGTTTTGGSTTIPSNPGSNGGSTNTNPGTTSTTAPGASQAPAASQAPTTSQAPGASDAPAASQAPGASDAPAVSQAPDATQTPDATQAPDATQKPSGDDDDDKNTGSKNDKEPVKKNNATAKKQNGVTLKVDTKKNGTATISTVKKTNKTTVTIGGTVTVNGVKYKVTTIGANAFKNCAKVKTVNLPSSVTTISKNAFAGAKKLKTIKITSKKAVTVKKGAFKGLNTKKMTVKVSKKMSKKQFNKMKKNLKKAGFKGKVKRV